MPVFAFVCFILALVVTGFGFGYFWAYYIMYRQNKKTSEKQEKSNKPKKRWKPNPDEPWSQDPDWWK